MKRGDIYMSDIVSGFIKKISWGLIILFVLRCVLSYQEVINDFSIYTIFGYAGEAISVTTILAFLYEKWFWRFDRFSNVPVLYKKYTGYLESNYDHQKRNAELEIVQTLFTISVIMKTQESKSKSLSAVIESVLGEKQLIYSYLNTPDSKYRNRSEVHYGTALLCCDELKTLKGNYYTDRKTLGTLYFEAILQ